MLSIQRERFPSLDSGTPTILSRNKPPTAIGVRALTSFHAALFILYR
jgi:hypothetical protein